MQRCLVLILIQGWALIQVNVHPTQDIGPKVGGGRCFVRGPFFARLRYMQPIQLEDTRTGFGVTIHVSFTCVLNMKDANLASGMITRCVIV